VVRSRSDRQGDLARYACLVVAVFPACPRGSNVVNGKAARRIN
jgi:hypothetical protein